MAPVIINGSSLLSILTYITLLQIWEAARAAHVTHFTDSLPQGLETQVGSRGTQLRLEEFISCVN